MFVSISDALAGPGVLVAQHHDYESEEYSLDGRAMVKVTRVVSRRTKAGQLGQWVQEKHKTGDLKDIFIWPHLDKPDRPMPVGSFILPVVTHPDAPDEQPHPKRRANGDLLGERFNMVPIREHGRVEDEDLDRQRTGYLHRGRRAWPRFPRRDFVGVAVEGLNTNEQVLYFHPTDPRMIAVNEAGDTQIGSWICDLDGSDEIDLDRCASMQTLTRVVKKPRGRCVDFRSNNAALWQTGPTGQGDGHGGLFDGTTNRIGAAPAAYTGLLATNCPGQHIDGIDADGNEITPVHGNLGALWTDGGQVDGPWRFDGVEPRDPGPGPHRVKVKYIFHPGIAHEWCGGAGAGKLIWYSYTHKYEPWIPWTPTPDGIRITKDSSVPGGGGDGVVITDPFAGRRGNRAGAPITVLPGNEPTTNAGPPPGFIDPDTLRNNSSGINLDDPVAPPVITEDLPTAEELRAIADQERREEFDLSATDDGLRNRRRRAEDFERTDRGQQIASGSLASVRSFPPSPNSFRETIQHFVCGKRPAKSSADLMPSYQTERIWRAMFWKAGAKDWRTPKDGEYTSRQQAQLDVTMPSVLREVVVAAQKDTEFDKTVERGFCSEHPGGSANGTKLVMVAERGIEDYVIGTKPTRTTSTGYLMLTEDVCFSMGGAVNQSTMVPQDGWTWGLTGSAGSRNLTLNATDASGSNRQGTVSIRGDILPLGTADLGSLSSPFAESHVTDAYVYGDLDVDGGTNLGGTRITANGTTLTESSPLDVFINTDGGDVTVNLPAAPTNWTKYRFVNTGGSGNTATVAADASDDLLGTTGDTFDLADGEAIVLTFHSSDGWY